MHCSNCQHQFNEDTNLPRILIFCGHTFCQACIAALVQEAGESKQFLCPDCKTPNISTDGVNSFPKNLVLLSVPAPGQGIVQKSLSPQKEAPSSAQSPSKTAAASNGNSKTSFCTSHKKKLEAFCEQCLKVLCIDCILSDTHKSHEIVSVSKAVEKQRDQLQCEQEYACKTEAKLKGLQNDLKKYNQELRSQSEKNKSEISVIYNAVREIILQREQVLKKQISDNVLKEEKDCIAKLEEISKVISDLIVLKNEVAVSVQEGDIELLEKAPERKALCELTNGPVAKDLAGTQIPQVQNIEIKRDQELIQVSRIVHPQFKGNPAQNSQGSTLYSHTLSTSNKAKRTSNLPASNENPKASAPEPKPQAKELERKGTAYRKKPVSPQRNNRRTTTSTIKNVGDQKGGIQKHNFQQVNAPKADADPKKKYFYQFTSTDDHSNSVCDDMSSIHHLAQDECYMNMSPKRIQTGTNNFNEILDNLDDSQHEQSPGKITKIVQNKTKRYIMSPKAQASPIVISSFGGDKGRNDVRSSLDRRMSGLDVEVKDARSRSGSRYRASQPKPILSNLSQERRKRKQEKATSKENSPTKTNNLISMINECTRKIEAQFDTRDAVLQENANKKAAICLVDLSKNDEPSIQKQVSHEIGEADAIKLNSSEEEKVSDQIVPYVHQDSKESSPLKRTSVAPQEEKCCEVSANEEESHKNTPKETPFNDNMETPFERADDSSLKNEESNLYVNTSPQKIMAAIQNDSPEKLHTDTSIISKSQQSISVDQSSLDPFKALCRMKEEFIFIFSGFNDSKLFSCEALDVQREQWREVACVSRPRTKFGAVPISKSRILLFGGKQIDGQRTAEIEEYNLKTNKFKTLPFKMPKPRSGFVACVKKEEGCIFFCGGNSGSVLRKFDCLDLKKGKWSRLPDMIQKRDELACALGPDGKVYAIGGYGGGGSQSNCDDHNQSNCLRTAERYDFEKGAWEMLPTMKEARRALAAVALPDGIYAIGGYDGKQYLSTVEKFDIQKQQWVTVKPMNQQRCTLAAVTSSDCQYIYAMGGFNGNSLDLVERFNIMSEEWEYMAPMTSKRFMHEAVNMISQ